MNHDQIHKILHSGDNKNKNDISNVQFNKMYFEQCLCMHLKDSYTEKDATHVIVLFKEIP